MTTAKEYGLGPNEFPRGWFVVAKSSELDAGPIAVTFFDQDFALYRGESGKVVMLDAYCSHMGTHLTASKSAIIVVDGKQIEGDSIRCPYHGWRYGPDGYLDDIPYHDGECPKSGALKSYEVREHLGAIMMWFDPEGGEPAFEPPLLPEWDSPEWIQWELDDLGEIDIHGIEIMDNMADAQHLGPTHGAPCEYFEVEFKDHISVQRQGGFHHTYGSYLSCTTWYTGPGVLLCRQEFFDAPTVTIIANTPVANGRTKVWFGALYHKDALPHSQEDIATAKKAQEDALYTFASDFDVWSNKKPALQIMAMKKDGPFKELRDWYGQFYDKKENIDNYHKRLNGYYHIDSFEHPSQEHRQKLDGFLLGET